MAKRRIIRPGDDPGNSVASVEGDQAIGVVGATIGRLVSVEDDFGDEVTIERLIKRATTTRRVRLIVDLPSPKPTLSSRERIFVAQEVRDADDEARAENKAARIVAISCAIALLGKQLLIAADVDEGA